MNGFQQEVYMHYKNIDLANQKNPVIATESEKENQF